MCVLHLVSPWVDVNFMQNIPKLYNYTINYAFESRFASVLTYLMNALLLQSEKIYNVFSIFFLEIEKKQYICNRCLQQSQKQKQDEKYFFCHPH